ncbi:MAG: hypothetical protein KGO83_04005 [Paenibacillaceae bacterium]|nr:hypothetical protein [Paenibacillaceae bacterium]
MRQAGRTMLWKRVWFGVVGAVVVLTSVVGSASAQRVASPPYKVAQTVAGEFDWMGVWGTFAALGSAAISAIVQSAATVYNQVVDALDCTNNPEACARVVNPADVRQTRQFVAELRNEGFVCTEKDCKTKIVRELERRADEQIIAQLAKGQKRAYTSCRTSGTLAACIAKVKKEKVRTGTTSKRTQVRPQSNGNNPTPTGTIPPLQKRSNGNNPARKAVPPPPQPAPDGASGRDGGSCSAKDIGGIRSALIAMLKSGHDIVPKPTTTNWQNIDPIILDQTLLRLMGTVLQGRTAEMGQQLRKLGAVDVHVKDGFVVVNCNGKFVYFKMYAENSKSSSLKEKVERNFFQTVLRN